MHFHVFLRKNNAVSLLQHNKEDTKIRQHCNCRNLEAGKKIIVPLYLLHDHSRNLFTYLLIYLLILSKQDYKMPNGRITQESQI